MEFLGNLGIDTKLLIAQIINFGLLLWLLTKFLYKPIIKRIEKDEALLRQAQNQKKALEQEKTAFAKQKQSEITRAKQRSGVIIKEAKEIANEIKKRTLKEAEQEKQAVIKQIRSRLSELEHREKPKPR
jgi:F-type H+-transporting ATPase subunit b